MSVVNLVLTLALFNGIAVHASRVLLALFLLDLGAEPLMVGILAAAFSFPPAVLSVSIGQLVDRIGARRPMIVGIICTGTGLLLPWLSPGIPAIFVAALATGLCTAICNVSLQNLVGLLGQPENRSRDYSNYAMMNATAGLIGPVVAGFSIDHFGHAYTCIVVAAITLLPLGLILLRGRLLSGARHRSPSHQGQPRQKGGRVMELLAGAGIRKTLAAGALQSAADNLFTFYLPVYAHAIGLSATVIGFLLGANAAATFVVRMFIPRLITRLGEQRLLVCAFYVGATGLILLPLFTHAVVLGVVSFAIGLGLGCTGPIITMLMFTNSPAGRSGEAVGLKITANHLTKVVSPVIFGFVAGAFGLLPVFWATAVMLGAGGWISRPKKKSADTGEP